MTTERLIRWTVAAAMLIGLWEWFLVAVQGRAPELIMGAVAAITSVLVGRWYARHYVLSNREERDDATRHED